MAEKITEKRPEIFTKKTIEQMKQYDAELVRGRFTYDECPGGTMKFKYIKYKGDPETVYELKDGEVCTIPRGVARHLASSGRMNTHQYVTDEKGNSQYRVGSQRKRYYFESLEFFDEDIKPNLYTVERV